MTSEQSEELKYWLGILVRGMASVLLMAVSGFVIYIHGQLAQLYSDTKNQERDIAVLKSQTTALQDWAVRIEHKQDQTIEILRELKRK